MLQPSWRGSRSRVRHSLFPIVCTRDQRFHLSYGHSVPSHCRGVLLDSDIHTKTPFCVLSQSPHQSKSLPANRQYHTHNAHTKRLMHPVRKSQEAFPQAFQKQNQVFLPRQLSESGPQRLLPQRQIPVANQFYDKPKRHPLTQRLYESKQPEVMTSSFCHLLRLRLDKLEPGFHRLEQLEDRP